MTHFLQPFETSAVYIAMHKHLFYQYPLCNMPGNNTTQTFTNKHYLYTMSSVYVIINLNGLNKLRTYLLQYIIDK